MKDYSKIKALAQSIIECIGDESEGENPKLPKVKDDNTGDQAERGTHQMPYEKDDGTIDFLPDESCDDKELCTDRRKGKKRKDDAIALFASTLASKFNK